MLRFITVDKMATESGYTRAAIYTKCNEGIWPEGQVWHRAPDGRILIDTEGYERWVLGAHNAIIKPTPARKRAEAREPGRCMLKPLV